MLKSLSFLGLLITLVVIGILYKNQIKTKFNPPATKSNDTVGKIPKKIPINQLPGATKKSLEDFAKNQQEKLDQANPTEDEK